MPLGRPRNPHLPRTQFSRALAERLARGLSREDIARLTGASVRTVGNWVEGRGTPQRAGLILERLDGELDAQSLPA